MATKKKYRELTQQERAALQRFAAAHGTTWKETLITRWLRGNVQPFSGSEAGDPTTLYVLRTQLGHGWLKDYGQQAARPAKRTKKLVNGRIV